MLRIKYFIYTVFLNVMFFVDVAAQGEFNNWYFGQWAGLNFNVEPPQAIITSAMYSAWGSASISDKTGNLLFYSNGANVWNKNNVIMSGSSSGLLGNMFFQSMQAPLIIPHPGLDDRYYLFYVAMPRDSNNTPLAYSIIDMSLNSGLGDIDTNYKDRILFYGASNKMTAAKHANGCYYWMIAHDSRFNSVSDTFYSYLITDTGIIADPVRTKVGRDVSRYAPSHAQGWMQTSPNGEKIAVTHNTSFVADDSVKLELFDFDKETGMLSNYIPLRISVNYGVIGVCFSPDNSKLYSCEYIDTALDPLVQYNLNAGTPEDIIASAYNVYSDPGTGPQAVQLGPDGKIYVAYSGSSSLSVINNPNGVGSECDFTYNTQYVGNFVESGLPNALTYLYDFSATTVDYNDSALCTDSAVAFYGPYGKSWDWDFGDPASGAFNTDTFRDVSHLFSDSGNFMVTLIVNRECYQSDTIINNLEIGKSFKVDLGPDTIKCTGESVLLNAGISGAIYGWSTGDSVQIINTTDTGIFTVLVTRKTCKSEDTIMVKDSSCLPEIFIPNVFSPNGDGINDSFLISGANIESIELFIFNRLGEKVFETSDVNTGWDGTEMHRKSVFKSTGSSYTYKLVIHTKYNNGTMIYKGNITLIE